MELVLFFLALIAAGSFYYLVLCSLYFAFTARSQFAALRLCWKLAGLTIVGIPLAGFGGALLAALVLHGQLSRSLNYRKVRDISASLVIAAICSVGIYFSMISLAFGILD